MTIVASRVTVASDTIGLRADGVTEFGNRGDGVAVMAPSHGDVIGDTNPVTGVTYANANGVSMQPVNAWQGIRADATTPGQYLITGTSGANGLLYVGPISGVGGTSYAVNYPGATSTSVYGPDQTRDGLTRLVGSYRDGDGFVHGFAYQGTTAGLSGTAGYRTIDYPGAQYTYVHSTMGGLAVGNADGPEGNAPIGTGHAFLYDLTRGAFLHDIVYPGSTSTTAYGLWDNGKGSYTIAGGYSTPGAPGTATGHGFLVDYDALTGRFSRWASYDSPAGRDFITHFEGISGQQQGAYTLVADSVRIGAASGGPAQGALATVRRTSDNTFGPAEWVDLNYPGTTGLTSANSVAGNQVVGVVIAPSGGVAYQATVNVGFTLSNVISANRGNGVALYGASDNVVAMNQIGTDRSGTRARGNGANGVRITSGAARNLIGGQATGGNDPTAGVFARPPQGNLISANRANGVLIDRGATANVLSGNFIGTAASGNAPLGNRLDGVAIMRANGNALIGCLVQQSPFVFYNVVSGNGGNGLRVADSNNTTVQANFLGAGADNATVVGNGGDGLLVSGSSRGTQVGGVIPLGNVISGNARDGIEVRDRASGFTSFNTFAGLFAFAGAAPNGRAGIRITSRGGDNLIRTSIVSGNLGDGIVLSGDATGVQVVDTAIGTTTSITAALPNGGTGIVLSGRARRNAIGGFLPSIEPRVTVSANLGYGIAVLGSARDNVIFNAYVGTAAAAQKPLGNGLGGILLGPGSRSTTLGGTSNSFANLLSSNLGPGLVIRSSRLNTITGNTLTANTPTGLLATGDCAGTIIRDNTIVRNTPTNVDLSGSRGIVFVP